MKLSHIILLLVSTLGLHLAAQATRAFQSSTISRKDRATIGRLQLPPFVDISGREHRLSDPNFPAPVVLVFLSSECPVSNKYTTRLNDLHASFSPRGVRLFGINSNAHETRSHVVEHARQAGYTFPVVKDAGNILADKFGAQITPEAIVLDSQGNIRYRGRIDDNEVDVKVRERTLRDALELLLIGKNPSKAKIEAFGCPIRRVTPRSQTGNVTFAKHVAPILFEHCVGCHRPGEVAPFSLLTYEQAAAWANEIKTYTEKKLMPPWKPAAGFNEFQDERRLTDKEIQTLAEWADSGAPPGDPKDLPSTPRFTEGWAFGEPDLVLTPDREYNVPTTGRDIYRHFVLPTNFSEDKHIKAVDVRPSNRTVVHHVLIFADTSGTARKFDGQDGQPGYTRFGGPGFTPRVGIGGWAPGNFPRRLPSGLARILPAGSDVVIQVHYHLSGKPETDQTKIGVYFAKEPVEKIVRVVPVMPLPPIADLLMRRVQANMPLPASLLRIPAGESNHEVRAQITLPQDVTAIFVTPHMHLIGRDMKVTATRPDGMVEPIVHIPNWDFNWQDTYFFKEPKHLPRGTKVEVVAHYDNSDANPRNPNRPPKLVQWGEETTDEMCIAFIGVTRDAERLTNANRN